MIEVISLYIKKIIGKIYSNDGLVFSFFTNTLVTHNSN